MSENYFELKKQYDAIKKLNDQRTKLYAKKRFSDILNKKFKTTMIGSLVSFEEAFGHLWGFGKKEHELTSEEIRWREIWEQARTDVLNKGNNQLRTALEELNQYTLEFDKYKEEFVVKKRETTNVE